MAYIDKIKLYNFKAFHGEETIELENKHLLLYGENGSGKSSIYWALYTVLQSSTKIQTEVQKYFEPQNDQNLINTHHIEDQAYIDENSGEKIYPNSIGLNANVEIYLNDETSFKIDSRGLTLDNTTLDVLQNWNRRCDFISHRLLINFYNYRNSKQINLWEVFVRDMFPFLKTGGGRNEETLAEELNEIENTLPLSFRTKNGRREFSVLRKSEGIKTDFNNRVNDFNRDVEFWITQINNNVNDFYEENFRNKEEKEISISLRLEKKLEYIYYYEQEYLHNGEIYLRHCNYVGLSDPIISLNIKIKNEDGSFSAISKPQSYFNEAKLTSIALAVRFSLLSDTIRPDFEGKFLALDDLLVSLDMSNRDKVLNIILNVFAPKYKIYLFTHEMEFFNYCKFKILQKKQKNDWKIQEIYSDDHEKKPVIIDSEIDYLEKSKKYFKAKDYVAASVFLRKDIENFIKIRVPDVFKKTTENEFHNLDHYWNLFVERYVGLGITIPPVIHQWFKQSKLIILNPSAHANLSQQIYKVELESAYDFRDKIETLCPLIDRILVIAEKTQFIFKHPTEDYEFEFYFKTDFTCEKLNQNINALLPKCIISTFSYRKVPFWNFRTSSPISNTDIERHIKNKDVDFNVMLNNLKREATLAIDDDMFYKNTKQKGSELTLDEILSKFKG